MANLIERGLERVNKRFPFFTPILLIILGLASVAYGGSLLLEWVELGHPQPELSSGQGAESRLEGKSGNGASPGNTETGLDPGSRLRLKRNLLLTGAGIMTVIGSMSIAFSVLWFGLVRAQLSRVEKSPIRLN